MENDQWALFETLVKVGAGAGLTALVAATKSHLDHIKQVKRLVRSVQHEFQLNLHLIERNRVTISADAEWSAKEPPGEAYDGVLKLNTFAIAPAIASGILDDLPDETAEALRTLSFSIQVFNQMAGNRELFRATAKPLASYKEWRLAMNDRIVGQAGVVERNIASTAAMLTGVEKAIALSPRGMLSRLKRPA